MIDVRVKGLSADTRKWSLHHRLLRRDELCAIMEVDGAWLDLQKRWVIAPPERLVKVFESLPRTDDFQLID